MLISNDILMYAVLVRLPIFNIILEFPKFRSLFRIQCFKMKLLGAALTFVADQVLLKGYGGDRYDVPDIVIIVTDGKSQDDPEQRAIRLKSRYVKLIVIGVGDSVHEPELNQMASPPTEKNVFKFTGYEMLNNKIGEIAGAIKQACYVSAAWSQWSNWEDCSVTCGAGKTERKRRCHHAEMGSRSCPGHWRDSKDCSFPACDLTLGGATKSEWNDWGAWSEWAKTTLKCSKKCGGGTFVGATISDDEYNTCNTQECPLWSGWNDWSVCSQSCGRGTQFRQRACTNHNNETSGFCKGKKEQIDECILGGCPFWSQWTFWSDCSSTCGTNVERTRTRRCVNNKMGDCDGHDSETDKCDVRMCPTWSQWADWSDCSKKCGYGSKSRDRTCINGNPRLDCPGISLEDKICKLDDCATWSAWSSLGQCSVTCGIGERTRTRSCLPGFGTCVGESTKLMRCRTPTVCFPTTTATIATTQVVTTTMEQLSAELLENSVQLKLSSQAPTNTTSCELPDDHLRVLCQSDECLLDCRVGYKLIGSPELTCNKHEVENTYNWNDTLPMCAEQCTEKSDIIFVVDQIDNEREAAYVRQFVKKFLALFVIETNQAQVCYHFVIFF